MARFKARLVAQGFSQVSGIDFCGTFASIVRKKLLQIYKALCLAPNLFIYQVDIIGAYLKSLLNDNKFPIFMKLSPRVYEFCHIRKRLLCRLTRSLYGLKQSKKLWNQNVLAFYKCIRFRQLNREPSILIWHTKDKISIIGIYVDDFLLASNEMVILKALKKLLGKKYKIKDLGEVKTIIGRQITKDSVAHTMKINQSAFIIDLIIEEGRTDCNANISPMKRGSAIEMNNLDDNKDTEL